MRREEDHIHGHKLIPLCAFQYDAVSVEPVWLLFWKQIFCIQNSKTGFVTVALRLGTCFKTQNGWKQKQVKHETWEQFQPLSENMFYVQ